MPLSSSRAMTMDENFLHEVPRSSYFVDANILHGTIVVNPTPQQHHQPYHDAWKETSRRADQFKCNTVCLEIVPQYENQQLVFQDRLFCN
jgi:hypothetical protein